jgi:cyclopropane-fatty-acyl-phospholipid synthase
VTAPAAESSSPPPLPALARAFVERFAHLSVAFELDVPQGHRIAIGRGTPQFRIIARNGRGLRALSTLDAGSFGDAYVAGDLDLEGDMLAPFALRGSMGDAHPLLAIWRFVEPMLVGQVRTNRRAIARHYDIDPDFFLAFLDPDVPCYTQGVYASDDESLATATRRKLAWCFDRCGLKAGDRMLEVGPGWGAWFAYASQRGVHCTGITNSPASIGYLTQRACSLGHDWTLIEDDFLRHRSHEKYDAIVIMGVIEHLPQYEMVLAKVASMLRPGGTLFVDASACMRKYQLSSYMVKYIYGGNHSFLVLHEFLAALARTPLELISLENDRHSYYLTFRQWALNFDAHRDMVIERFGEFDYRRFRLYLWGAAYEFASRSLDSYRMIIRNSASA